MVTKSVRLKKELFSGCMGVFRDRGKVQTLQKDCSAGSCGVDGHGEETPKMFWQTLIGEVGRNLLKQRKRSPVIESRINSLEHHS